MSNSSRRTDAPLPHEQAMIEINHNPSRRDLLIFAALLPVLFAVLGALRWHAGSLAVAKLLWIGGAALSVLVFALPGFRRALYIGWMYVAYPIAWTMSHLLLAVAYFLVATPLALLLRALGRDPMRRRFDADAPTYWTPREGKRDPSRYFRQF
jgi:saxitoxin biosynthesis operon SxtJ-like protein